MADCHERGFGARSVTSVVSTESATEARCDNLRAVQLPEALRQANVTPREAEVLEALGSRLTNAEIADRFVISVRTVESHVSALLGKLDATDRRALARIAADIYRDSSVRPVGFPRTLDDALPSQAHGSALVGRDSELARLRARHAQVVVEGRRRLAVIVGDPGIGKTALAATIAREAHLGGAVVLHGRSDAEAVVSFQAFAEAVRPLIDGANDAVSALLAEGQASGPIERYGLFERFDRLLSARSGAIVLVLDDAQWLDPSGLQLLRHLLRGGGHSPLLLIATTRPEGMDPGHPFAATVATEASTTTIESLRLTGLSLTEVEAMARDVGPASADRVREAWRRTGGNPFFARELLRRPAGEASLPSTARDAIARRVVGLGSGVSEALTTAAVLGEGFRSDVVASMLRTEAGQSASAIDSAWRAGLITTGNGRDEYRFAHAIVRDALLEITPPGRRAALHLAAAEVLERTGARAALPEIAHHRHAALPMGDPNAACRAALAAAEAATDRYAYEVAATYASMALDALDAGGAEANEDAERAAVLIVRGEAHLRAADLALATGDFRTALDHAWRAGDERRAAQAVLGWAAASPRWEQNPELGAALAEVLDRGTDDLAIRAGLRASLARVRYFEGDRDVRVQLSRDAVADARASGRADALASVLSTTHAALWAPEDLDERIAVSEEVVWLGRRSGHHELEAHGLGWLVADRLEAGDVSATDRALAQHAVLASRLRQRLLLRDVELWRAMRAMLDGRFDDAHVMIERARDMGEAAGDPAVEPTYWVQRYWLGCEQGRRDELDALVEPCARFARLYKHVPAWRAALALLHARRGDPAAARREYEDLAAGDFVTIPRDFVWLNAVTYLAETCAFLGDAGRATVLYALLLPYAGRLVLIDRALACRGSVERFLGLLAATTGDSETASRHLDAAVRRHDAMGARPLAERSRRERSNRAG